MLVALGMARNAMEADFFLYHEKCFFHIWSTEIGFFMKQLPKREIESWEKHPT
jgi:hypothetical protein